MTRNVLIKVLEKLINLSQKTKTKLVIMGGISLSILARPRTTYDIDGMISLKKDKIKEFLHLLNVKGFRFDNKKQIIKFIEGLPFITFYYPLHKLYVDLFIAKTEFQYKILERAKKVKLNKLNLYIISPEDLILVKLQTGREKDIEDVREIIIENKSKIDFIYLNKWAKMLNVHHFLKDELKSLKIR